MSDFSAPMRGKRSHEYGSLAEARREALPEREFRYQAYGLVHGPVGALCAQARDRARDKPSAVRRRAHNAPERQERPGASSPSLAGLPLGGSAWLCAPSSPTRSRAAAPRVTARRSLVRMAVRGRSGNVIVKGERR